MNYSETLAYLYASLPFFQKQGEKAYKPKLTNIIALCDHLDNPQNHFKTIHVAGTNGKGSSSHFLASIFQESNYKTGLYTSPHLKDFRERFKINGKMVAKGFVTDFIKKHKSFLETLQPSFFEVSVALAFELFKDENVDVAIIEVGLGGLFDSTNIIKPELSLITNIGYDHMNILGHTLEEIAFQKAGIIKENTPVVISEYLDCTKSVFEVVAKEKKAAIYFASDLLEAEIIQQGFSENQIKLLDKSTQDTTVLYSGLLGEYQKNNILGVFKAVEVLKSKFPKLGMSSVTKGFKNVIKHTNLKGRWQILNKSPLTVADTGHNEHAFRLTLKKTQSYSQVHYILGFVKDKDLESVFKMLPKKGSEYYFCTFDSFRAAETSLLAEYGNKYGLKFSLFENVNTALDTVTKRAQKQDFIFIGGSTFLVAEINKL
jgi:dihydrofolate synthase / folylpolyglutamate synthase